ncbi:MAG: nucleoside monophosphate kinase [Acidobacteria bacterium]|nr:nucleoside monophosphate kinase [Acidobacteriota bacterium]
MVLLFFGPPGSGKGTQTKLITDWLRINTISTGEIFRAEVQAGTPLGRAAQNIMNSGGLVGDDIVNAMLENRLSSLDLENGILLDGYPRTIPQAEFLDRFLTSRHLPEPTVLHLDSPRDIIIHRVSGRRHCPVCNRNYNVYFQPPRDEGVCDIDGQPLSVREDDREEIVRERLLEYDRRTGPLLGYYKGRDYQRIDGNRPPEEVAREVATRLEGQLVRVRSDAAARRRRGL